MSSTIEPQLNTGAAADLSPQPAAAAAGTSTESSADAPAANPKPQSTLTRLRWKKAVTTITVARAFATASKLRSAADETPAEKYENLRRDLRRTMSRRPNIDDDDLPLVSIQQPSSSLAETSAFSSSSRARTASHMGSADPERPRAKSNAPQPTIAGDDQFIAPAAADGNTHLAMPQQQQQQLAMASRKSFRRQDGYDAALSSNSTSSSAQSPTGTAVPIRPSTSMEDVVYIDSREQYPSSTLSSPPPATTTTTPQNPFFSQQQQQSASPAPARTAPCSIFSCVSCRRAITIEPFSLAYFLPPTVRPAASPSSGDQNEADSGRSGVGAPMGPSGTLCVRYAEDPSTKGNSAATAEANDAPVSKFLAAKKSPNPTIAWQETVRNHESFGRGTLNLTVYESKGGSSSNATTTRKTVSTPLTFWRKRQTVQLMPKTATSGGQLMASASSPSSPHAAAASTSALSPPVANASGSGSADTFAALLPHAPFTIAPAVLADLRSQYVRRVEALSTVGQPVISNYRSNFGLAAQTVSCDTAIGVDITNCTNLYNRYASAPSSAAVAGAAKTQRRPHDLMIENVSEALYPFVKTTTNGNGNSGAGGGQKAIIAQPRLGPSNWAGNKTSHLPATAATIVPNLSHPEASSSPPALNVVAQGAGTKASGFFSHGQSAATAGPPFTSGFSIDRSIVPEALAYNPDVAMSSNGSSALSSSASASDGFREAAVAMSVLTRGHRCPIELLQDGEDAAAVEREYQYKGHSHKQRADPAAAAASESPASVSAAAITPLIALKVSAPHRAQRKRLLALYETVSEQAGGVDLPLCAACSSERSVALQTSIADTRSKIRELTNHLNAFDEMERQKVKAQSAEQTTSAAVAWSATCQEAYDISILLLGAGAGAATDETGEVPSAPVVAATGTDCIVAGDDAAAQAEIDHLDNEIDALQRELQALLVQEKSEIDATEAQMAQTASANLNSSRLDAYISESNRWRESSFSRLVETLRTQSAMTKAFRFDFVKPIAMINDLRVGRHSSSFLFQSASSNGSSEHEMPSNEEINCGCGFLLQLVLLLASRRGIQSFSRHYKLIYRGSQSIIEARPPSGKVESFDFFINTKLFSWNTFGSAWVAFASCVSDIMAHYDKCVGELKQKAATAPQQDQGHATSALQLQQLVKELPSMPLLPISNEDVGGYSIKYGSASDEQWTGAVRHLMILLNWCVEVEGKL